ncbi:hypothetical protein LXA47_19320 [Massilia sp. P8910]|uniref:hypothetical protein n=1 Tax=Massilia antarctica TaxID=2765360 RepID=UPI001E518DC8|nr:hypothetical protein [Massilia antarctica]MCE3605738.1 hypothetical protein [Massilia antarctica]
MASTNLKVRSGNRTVVSFDGNDIGLVQNVRTNDEYGHEPASGIGDARAVEYVPGMARHSISVSKMVLLKELVRAAGVTAENSADVLKGRVFDIVQYGVDENDILRKYTGCTFVSGDTEVVAHRIVTSNAQFMALDVSGVGM